MGLIYLTGFMFYAAYVQDEIKVRSAGYKGSSFCFEEDELRYKSKTLNQPTQNALNQKTTDQQ